MVAYQECHVYLETQAAKINDAVCQKQQELQLDGDVDNTGVQEDAPGHAGRAGGTADSSQK